MSSTGVGKCGCFVNGVMAVRQLVSSCYISFRTIEYIERERESPRDTNIH
jgi:hypothetical protein